MPETKKPRARGPLITWESQPWRVRDKLDAYVWVRSATGTELAELRGLEGQPGKARVRKVHVLAGPYDALVCVTANTLNDLEKLVIVKIHSAIGATHTETCIALWPKGGGRTPWPGGATWGPKGPKALYRL